MASRKYCNAWRLAAGYLSASLVSVTASSPEQVSQVTTGAGQYFFTSTDHAPVATAPVLFLPSPSIAQLGPVPTVAAKAQVQGLAAAVSSTETSLSISITTIMPTVTVTITTPSRSSASQTSSTTSGAMGNARLAHLGTVKLLSGLLATYLII